MSVALLLWLVIGALLIGGELVTGTFYLLIFGVAAWAGAAAAYLGHGIDVQLALAGVTALAGLVIVARYGKRWRRTAGPGDTDLDVGNEVRIETVLDGARIKVSYRGTTWDADFEGDRPPVAGDLAVIRAVHGSTLRVAPRPRR